MKKLIFTLVVIASAGQLFSQTMFKEE